MRSEQEIRDELERIEKELKDTNLVAYTFQVLNVRKWALKWVLGEEE